MSEQGFPSFKSSARVSGSLRKETPRSFGFNHSQRSHLFGNTAGIAITLIPGLPVKDAARTHIRHPSPTSSNVRERHLDLRLGQLSPSALPRRRSKPHTKLALSDF